ncbi:MAG: hypothetical protein A2156_14015 [Deltaproteobacteria bacterium RBG_16_48_10]|nr:MAG: hypothetical protein A2156_14015 [Deltaproteobacteria bacterium RBG_16_48_10]
MGKKGFKDLIIWQKAKDLAIKVYEASEEGELNRDFGLHDQVRRSAVSIASVLSQKKLYTFCHSGLDPESSVFDLDSRFRGNDDSHHHCKEVLEILH